MVAVIGPGWTALWEFPEGYIFAVGVPWAIAHLRCFFPKMNPATVFTILPLEYTKGRLSVGYLPYACVLQEMRGKLFLSPQNW